MKSGSPSTQASDGQVFQNTARATGCFRRFARLTRPEQFQRALSHRPVGRSALFVCHHCKQPPDSASELSVARLGLVVPKRFAKQAVRRNAIKRVIREAFRKNLASLPKGDLVIRLRCASPSLSLAGLKTVVRAEIEEIFLALGRQPR